MSIFMIVGYNYNTTQYTNIIVTKNSDLIASQFNSSDILKTNLEILFNEYIFGLLSGGLFAIFILIVNSFNFGLLLKISVDSGFYLEFLSYAIFEITSFLIACKYITSFFIRFYKINFDLKKLKFKTIRLLEIILSILLIILSSTIEKYIML